MKNYRGLSEGRTEGQIIISLRLFEPVDCGCMRCTQLWAAQFYRQNAMQITSQRGRDMDRQRDIDKEIWTDRHISVTVPQWAPSDPSLGDKRITTLDPHTRN